MNILVLGGGGREHALGWKIKQSPLVAQLYFAPGNASTAELGANVELDLADHGAVAQFCREKNINLVVPGPDDLLAAGIVDDLSAQGILTFGPMKAAAEIEWSKAYAKEVMRRAGIPTARSQAFADASEARAYIREQPLPLVIKADGLALGKGVAIAQTLAEADDAVTAMMEKNAFGAAGARIVIEELLDGIEISIHALCAGTAALLFPTSQDHKRAFDGDEGPNTGGMGVIAPVPGVSPETLRAIRERIVLPLLRELLQQGRPFNGLLYPGIMLTSDGPKVIEFNARFGDPETEAYMRLLESDLVPALISVAHGSLEGIALEWSHGSVACVMMASGGYPSAYEKGKVISGISAAEAAGAIVFHAATRDEGAQMLTNGGRVLAVTATGADLQSAIDSAYAAVSHISFDGAHYRRDIGAKSLGY